MSFIAMVCGFVVANLAGLVANLITALLRWFWNSHKPN